MDSTWGDRHRHGLTPLERMVLIDRKMDRATVMLALVTLILFVNAVSLLILLAEH